MSEVRVEVDSAGVEALLNSPEVEQDIRRRLAAIAAQAGDGFSYRTYKGRDRIRGQVWTATHAARLAEAQDRVLIRAVDAGRQ